MEAEFVVVVSAIAILVGLWLVVDGWRDFKAVADDDKLRPFAIVYFVTQNALGLVQTIFFFVALVVLVDLPGDIDLVILLAAIPVILLAIQLYTFWFKRQELRNA